MAEAWPSHPSAYQWKGTYYHSERLSKVLAYCKQLKKDVCIRVETFSATHQGLKDKASESDRIRMLMHLNHPNLLTPVHSFHYKDQLWILHRPCNGRSVAELFTSHFPNGIHDKELVASLLFHVVNAVKYLHDNKVDHKIISPQSILFDKDRSLTVLQMIERDDVLQNHVYIDPLILVKDPKVSHYQGNVFSIGIIALQLVHGAPPKEVDESIVSRFKAMAENPNSDDSEAYQWLHRKLTEKELPFKSEPFEDFVEKCLKECEQRIDINNLLKHKMLTEQLSLEAKNDKIGHLFEEPILSDEEPKCFVKENEGAEEQASESKQNQDWNLQIKVD